MGVERPTMSSASHSVDLYVPPALRNKDTVTAPAISTAAEATDFRTTSNTSSSSTDEPDSSFSIATERQFSTPTARRERRPDRAVYVPRPRRSQTTPPTTTVISMKPSSVTATTPVTPTALGAESFSADDSFVTPNSALKDKLPKTGRNRKEAKRQNKRSKNPAPTDSARTKPSNGSSASGPDLLPQPTSEFDQPNRQVASEQVARDTSNINEHRIISTCPNPADEDDADDWDKIYNDDGDCLDPKIVDELTKTFGKVKIERPKTDYAAFQAKESKLNEEDFPHVLEISNFPVEFQENDLFQVFAEYKESGFSIKWVDDTHALAVFSCSKIAAEVLTKGHCLVQVKPLSEATSESRQKAKRCGPSLQPYKPRPATCAALARRLVSGALGVRLSTAAADRENERRVLREAKERKIQAAKQRDEAWES